MSEAVEANEIRTDVRPVDVTVEVTLAIKHTVKVKVRTKTDRPMTAIADAALKQYQEYGGLKWASSFGSNLEISPAESGAEIESFRTVKVERW